MAVLGVNSRTASHFENHPTARNTCVSPLPRTDLEPCASLDGRTDPIGTRRWLVGKRVLVASINRKQELVGPRWPFSASKQPYRTAMRACLRPLGIFGDFWWGWVQGARCVPEYLAGSMGHIKTRVVVLNQPPRGGVRRAHSLSITDNRHSSRGRSSHRAVGRGHSTTHSHPAPPRDVIHVVPLIITRLAAQIYLTAAASEGRLLDRKAGTRMPNGHDKTFRAIACRFDTTKVGIQDLVKVALLAVVLVAELLRCVTTFIPLN